MAWKRKTSTPEEIGEEVKLNLQDKNENARILILGTETPDGYIMRMTLKNPEAIAGIIYNHAIKTGELDEALQMCESMVKIGVVAEKLIREKVLKSQQNN